MDELELFRTVPGIPVQSLFRADGGADLDAIRATILETADVILTRDTTNLTLIVAYGADCLQTAAAAGDADKLGTFLVVDVDFEPADQELHRFLGLVDAVRGHQDSPFWRKAWHAVDGTAEEFVVDRTDPLYREPAV